MTSMVLPLEEEQTLIENLSYYRHDPGCSYVTCAI